MLPEKFDAFEINKALQNKSPNYKLLIEIFTTRNSTQLEKIKIAYEEGLF